MLVIMTSYQKAVDGPSVKKICIDSTHGTTGYDFSLTTLVTVDEYGAGFPLAVCISNF